MYNHAQLLESHVNKNEGLIGGSGGQKPRLRHRGPDKYPLILNTARQLVAASGFREVQMSAIAEAAGIAIGTLYRYFPAKVDLMVEVVGLVAQREVDVVASVASAAVTPAEKLGAAAWCFASRALRGRRMAHALVAEPVEPEVEAARLKYHRALGQVFYAVIVEGIQSGDFPPQNAQASADCIVGCLFEGLVSPLTDQPDSDDDKLAAHSVAIISFCLRGVSGRPMQFVPTTTFYKQTVAGPE